MNEFLIIERKLRKMSSISRIHITSCNKLQKLDTKLKSSNLLEFPV